jgi:hypothetical protein
MMLEALNERITKLIDESEHCFGAALYSGEASVMDVERLAEGIKYLCDAVELLRSLALDTTAATRNEILDKGE